MNQTIETLKVIFPMAVISKLEEVLANSNNNLDLACAILLSELEDSKAQHEKDQDILTMEKDLYTLFDMFPNVLSHHIKSVYIKNQQDINRTIQELLNFCILTPEDVQNQKEYDARSKAHIDNLQGNKKYWKNNKESIQLIIDYGNVSPEIASKAFFTNSFNSIKALINLVYCYDDYLNQSSTKSFEQQSDMLGQNNITMGGKVQFNQDISHRRDQTQLDFNNSKNVLSKKNVCSFPRNYICDNSSPQYIELKSIIQSNHALKNINSHFFKKALEFYNGDVIKTVSLGLLIADHNCSSFTFEFMTSQDSNSKNTSYQKSTHKGNIKDCRIKDNKNLGIFSDSIKYERAIDIIDNLFNKPIVDLHNFFPDEAEAIVNECLKRWWLQEKSLRERNKQNLKQIKVLNVPQLVIITGRGIHSVGGKSVIRQKIKKILIDGHYLILEEPSYFVILGKKRR